MPVLEQEQNLKQLMKEAVKEAIVENGEMFKEMLAELLEDIALLQRMEEGRETEFVDRESIMELLKEKK